MKSLRITLLSLPLALLAACCCNTPEESTAAAVPAIPAGQHIGTEVQPQQTVRFAVVDATPANFFNKTVLVEATIKAVCQTKGCWMQVEDQGKTAMVRWESGCGGKFAFPKDAAGKHVVIQGSFYPKQISEEDAKHLEEEAGKPLQIKREGYEFNASAVIVVDAAK